MRLDWLLARLRNMSAGEIVHRVAERQRRFTSRRRHQGWDRFAGGALVTALPGLGLAPTPEQRSAIAAAAAAAMAGRFSALGVDWPPRAPDHLFPASLWRLSPETGRAWPGPETYCFDVDFRQTDIIGEIKYVWEMNRLQLLQPLAAQVALAGGTAELGAIEQAIESWYRANPPFGGVGWNGGIEVALRAISLLIVASFVGDRLSSTTLDRVAAILRASAFWLKRFPSHYSSANNHLMAELGGIYLIAVALGDTAGAASAQAAIEREVLKQILPDGVGAEQTPTYAAFTAEIALLCAVVAKASGTPFAGEAMTRLGLLAGFVAWLEGPDGVLPAIGDNDEGRAITLCQPEPGYPGSIAAAIQGVLGQGGSTAPPVTLRNAIVPAPARRNPPLEGARTFDVGGYSVWRGHHAGHDLHAVLDHGPLGYLSIAAHGHADALALWLAIDGRPVLVDPGTYRYQAGGAWRTWFRSTQAHNTLTVQGASQSLAAGAFNWSHKAAARLDSSTDEPWQVVASHDGYQRRFGVRHQRTVTLTEQGLTIHDALPGAAAPLSSTLTFQLAADLSTQVEDNTVAVSRAGVPVLRLTLPSPAIHIVRAGNPDEGGWVSTAFGHKTAADRVVWTGTVDASGITTQIDL